MNWSENSCVKAGKPAVIVTGQRKRGPVVADVEPERVDAALSGAGSLAYQNTMEGNRCVILRKPLIKVMYGMGFRKDDLQFGEALRRLPRSSPMARMLSYSTSRI